MLYGNPPIFDLCKEKKRKEHLLRCTETNFSFSFLPKLCIQQIVLEENLHLRTTLELRFIFDSWIMGDTKVSC